MSYFYCACTPRAKIGYRFLNLQLLHTDPLNYLLSRLKPSACQASTRNDPIPQIYIIYGSFLSMYFENKFCKLPSQVFEF